MLDEFRSTYITWDKATRRIYSPVTANASDENGRKLVVQIVNSGQVEDLTGSALHLYWETRDKLHDGLDVFKAVDLKKGEFELSYTTGMLSNHGVLNANLVLIDTVGRVVSERFKITVTEGVDNNAIQSENSFSSLTQALIDISNLEQNYAPRLNDLTAQLQQTDEEITKLKKNIIYVRASTELKSALENVTAGQTILLQEAKYIVDTNIVMNSKNHVVITGLGRAEIEFIGTGDFITLNDCFGVEFRNIQLFHATATNAGSGLVLNRCQRINLIKLTIYNFQYDLLKTIDSLWLRSDDCIFDKGLTDTHTCVNHGRNSNNVVHYHSRFVTRGLSDVIDINGGYGITIDNCDISGAGENIGIKRNASTSVNITNNYFEGNLISIQLGSTGYLETGLIQGNYFNIQGGNDDKVGIDIVLGSNIKIVSNMFLGNKPAKVSIGVRVADSVNNRNIIVDSDNTFTEVTTKVDNPNNRVSYNQRKRIYATTPPTTDLWIVGDRVINSDTKVLTDGGTQYFISEWVCVGSGTPGIWKDVRFTI